MNFQEIVAEINNAFLRIENYMNGTRRDYSFFGFKEAFTNLFDEARKNENYAYEKNKLIGRYWELLQQIYIDFDKGDIENQGAYENEMFCRECDEIQELYWGRIMEFNEFSNPDEIVEVERKVSIADISQTIPQQPIDKSPFSIFQWATIFYYADETKLLPENRLIKNRLEQFMSKHQLNTTFDYFRTMYYEAKHRINKKNDYPIGKLESIIPFLKENYTQTVAKAENDIIFLKENKPDY